MTYIKIKINFKIIKYTNVKIKKIFAIKNEIKVKITVLYSIIYKFFYKKKKFKIFYFIFAFCLLKFFSLY